MIGHSSFEVTGLPRGVIRGRFDPSPDYMQVRTIFRADAVARARPEDPDGERVLAACYVVRDRLSFAIRDPHGVEVPVEYMHVYEPPTRGSSGDFEVVARLAVPPAEPSRQRVSRLRRIERSR